MKCFADLRELLRFARGFIDDRLSALNKDVAHCLKEPFAPFPAIMFCFSTINLFGALYKGDASKNAKSTIQSSEYMQKFMHYSKEQSDLLLGIFRHKIVHLAQPNPYFKIGSRVMSWGYWHNDRTHHLKMTNITPPVEIQVSSSLLVKCDCRFEISISHFIGDINASVHEPEGYYHKLKKDKKTQEYFDKAIYE